MTQPPQPLERSSLVDVLEDRISQDILKGRYPADSLLPPERELASVYRVTRTTVKHTLVRLKEKGLIETRHGVGSRVRDFIAEGGAELLPLLVEQAASVLAGGAGTVDGARLLDDIFESRSLFGAVIARQAASRCGAADGTELRRLVAAVQTAPDADAAQAAEVQLHRAIGRLSGNQVFLFLTNTMLKAYELLVPTLRTVFPDSTAHAAALRPLVDAICRRNAKAAEAAAVAYYERTRRAMISVLSPVPPRKTRQRGEKR